MQRLLPQLSGEVPTFVNNYAHDKYEDPVAMQGLALPVDADAAVYFHPHPRLFRDPHVGKFTCFTQTRLVRLNGMEEKEGISFTFFVATEFGRVISREGDRRGTTGSSGHSIVTDHVESAALRRYLLLRPETMDAFGLRFAMKTMMLTITDRDKAPHTEPYEHVTSQRAE